MLLVAVALLPLAGLATFAARDAVIRWQITHDTDRVVANAELVEHLLVAKQAIAIEADAVTALRAAAEVGVGADFIRDVIGIDYVVGIVPARERFDLAIAEIESARESGAPFAAPDEIEALLSSLDVVDEIRAAVDSSAVEADHADALVDAVLAPIEAATTAQIDALGETARSIGANGSVDKAARDARQALLVSDLVRAEGVALAMYVVPIRPPDNPVPDPSFVDLVTASAVAAHEVVRIDTDLGPTGQALWSNVEADPVYQDYVELRDRAVAGEIDAMANPGEFADVALAGNAAMSNSTLTTEFASALNDRVIIEADLVGAGARDELRESAVLAGLIGLATLLGILLLSGAIVRPLRRLEARARRISDGDLDHEEDHRTSGPREIAVVDTALTDLVSGLRVLETQAEALAVADLSSPSLSMTSPGRLGESLRRSVDQLSAMASRLDHQANHDELTGLLNRKAGIAAIESALARARRSRRDVAVLFVDLDGFKAINDVHGHPVGDRVLAEIANRITVTGREADPVARFGGDEFIVVVDDLAEIATAVTVADRIVDAVAQPIDLGDLTVGLSASIGIAWSPRGETLPETLVVHADLALYRAKEKGKGRVEIFDEHLQRVVNRRAVVEASLTRAIRDERLEVWYQPIVATRADAVWGCEALVRWRRRDGMIVPPDDFIAVAERSDLVLALDRYVLERACHQLVAWRDDPVTRDLKLSVNVSGRHLDAGDLMHDVRDVLGRTGAPADRLVVEMTETRLVRDLDRVAHTLGDLRDLGLGVAIDDFGTGYASVAHLRRFPATHLKIDRSFISGSNDPTDRSILELLAWLGDALELDVVAEGIETERQLALVKELGCTHAQGFLFSRPLPDDEIGAWLLQAMRHGVRPS